MKRLDNRAIPAAPGEIRAFIVARDEMSRLPENLRHHRALGVDRFFVVDNGSTDGTLDFLLAQGDAHVFATSESYAESRFGLVWLNELLAEHGVGHWTLTVDADEWLAYPRFETIGLKALCARLDATGAEGLFCLLLDMYARGPISGATPAPGQSPLDVCPWFDLDGYRFVRAEHFPHLQAYGGVRERVFTSLGALAPHPPTISKIPLVKWRADRRFLLSAHALTPTPLAKTTGALLHFKFLSDFAQRVEKEVARGEHFGGAVEYRAYAEILARDGDLVFWNARSRRWTGADDLVALGLMASDEGLEEAQGRA